MIKNKNILITGGNSGIGFFAIINLLKTKNILYVVIKNEFRKNEFLRKIEKYFDKECNYSFQDSSIEVKETWANITKSEKLLEFAPTTEFSKGMSNFLDWFKSYKQI